MLVGKTILIDVTGAVAAHHVPELIGQLHWRQLANLQVVMTPTAARCITPLALQVASRNPVYAGLWQGAERTLRSTYNWPAWQNWCSSGQPRPTCWPN